MSHMIRSNLCFETVLRDSSWTRHDSSIVDKNVKLIFKFMEFLGKLTNRFHRCEVELKKMNIIAHACLLDLLQSILASLIVATSDVNFTASFCKIDGCFLSNSRISSRDNDNFAINPRVLGVLTTLNEFPEQINKIN